MELRFSKYYIAGKDYILTRDTDLSKEDIIYLCDRQKGIGADGIFTVTENSGKFAPLRAFLSDGRIMQDLSAASICADFETHFPISCDKSEKHLQKSDFSPIFRCRKGNISSISVDMGKGEFSLPFPAISKKTELGNRILTLTAISHHGIHTVHFTEGKPFTDYCYAGKYASRLCQYKKTADFTLAEKTQKNCFDLYHYENSTGCCRPSPSVYSAVALCACKNNEADFDREIRLNCNGNTVYAFCNKDYSAVILLDVYRAFEGTLDKIYTETE